MAGERADFSFRIPAQRHETFVRNSIIRRFLTTAAQKNLNLSYLSGHFKAIHSVDPIKLWRKTSIRCKLRLLNMNQSNCAYKSKISEMSSFHITAFDPLCIESPNWLNIYIAVDLAIYKNCRPQFVTCSSVVLFCQSNFKHNHLVFFLDFQAWWNFKERF